MTLDVNVNRVNINQPRWDQNTFIGRAKHFFVSTNPLNLLCTPKELDHAHDIVVRYRKGEKIPGLTEEDLWREKHIFDSAFHPDTGEKMVLIGRMSAQVPMNMTITGFMMTFHKTTKAVVFWQWINQSFNAIVNYSNRSGDSPITVQRLGISYVLATGGALATALGLNSLVKKAPPLIGRLVPFTAVAAANFVNIPIMRSKELHEGIPVTDKNGKRLGVSTVAARDGIFQVVLSRIGMAVPGMACTPVLMDHLERKGVLKRYPMIAAPLQVLLCGICLTFATPLCCAVFPQQSSISVWRLEPEIQERSRQLPNPPRVLYYNKGL